MTKQQRDQERKQLNRKMRRRLIRIIDNPSISDSEALKAIAILWEIDCKYPEIKRY